MYAAILIGKFSNNSALRSGAYFGHDITFLICVMDYSDPSSMIPLRPHSRHCMSCDQLLDWAVRLSHQSLDSSLTEYPWGCAILRTDTARHLGSYQPHTMAPIMNTRIPVRACFVLSNYQLVEPFGFILRPKMNITLSHLILRTSHQLTACSYTRMDFGFGFHPKQKQNRTKINWLVLKTRS